MKTVLVVDDTPALLSLVTTLVKMAKHVPLEATCGEEALEVAARTPEMSALITDIRMPGMSGFDLARDLRKSRPNLPILFISGYFDSAEQDHMQWVREPNVAFLPKPFPPASLLQHLNSLLLV